MATPKIIADFQTQLSAAISVGDTSFTIASATDDDGVSLPGGLYYFTIDSGSSQKEYLAGTLSGTTVSSVVNVSRQGTETSGADRAHRLGASVVLTDFNTYKKYMDEIALVSAPDASTSVKGVVEAATVAEVRAGTASGGTGAVLAVTPDVLDDLPTADEKAALAGGGDFGTPNTDNKYLTEDGLDAKTFTINTTSNSGTTTRAANATGTQTIAHGLGVTPTYVKIIAAANLSNTINSVGEWYSGDTYLTLVTSQIEGGSTSQNDDSYIITSAVARLVTDPDDLKWLDATVSVDATNITLTWASNNSPDTTGFNIGWLAKAQSISIT